MMSILSFLILFLIGFAAINIFWSEEGIISHLKLKFCLAFGIGSGITSILYFFYTLFKGSSFKSVVITELILLAGLTAILFYKKPLLKSVKEEGKIPPKNILNRIISGSFYITAISSFVSFILFSLKDPHGTWDAWLIWNLHARFIYRLNGHLAEFFKNCPDWSHPDYPTLIPAAISRLNLYVGHEQLLSGMLIAALFAFGLVFLLSFSLATLKTKNQGYLAGIVLFSTFLFIQQAASQYADIPLAFFILSTLVLLCLKDKFNNYALLIPSGFMAGLAAWSKNEGILFLISIFLARFIAIWLKRGLRSAFKELALIFAGLSPLLIGLIYFKTQLTPANDLFLNWGTGDVISKILTPARYSEIFSLSLFVIKTYFCRLTGIPLLVIYALLMGINIKYVNTASINTIIITLCLMLAGFFGIYLIDPHNLYWHINTSLYRLLLQLWPGFLLLFFLVVKTPDETILYN